MGGPLAHEVERLVLKRGGDDVPTCAAAADVVEGGEAPREVVGRVVGRGRGRDEADSARHHRERGEERQRLGAFSRIVAQVRSDGELVGEEDRVQLTPFRSARELGVVFSRQGVMGLGCRQPPRALVVAGAEQEGVDVKLALSYHAYSFRELEDVVAVSAHTDPRRRRDASSQLGNTRFAAALRRLSQVSAWLAILRGG